MRLTGLILALSVSLCPVAFGAEGGPAKPGAAARTDDWPKWLGPNGDGISRETGLLGEWPADGPKKVWSARVGRGYSSPVAVDGKVYMFSMVSRKDTLTAFDAEKGKEVWTKSYNNAWTGQYAGTRATPTIQGGRIYTYGGGGDLVCRNLADGKQVWNINVLKTTGSKNIKWGMASSPTIVGDVIYVQSGDGGSVAVAVNKKTGKVIWQSQGRGMGSYAAVLPISVGAGRQVVVFAGKGVVGMDAATGRTLWAEPWTTSWDVHAATPVYRDGHLFITSGYNHGCMMLKFNGAKPKKLWEKKAPHSKFVPPILDGDHLYVNSEGTLMCLRWPDGEVKWNDRSLGLGIGGAFVRVGDKLIAMTERGQLELAQATPAGCKLISKVRLFSGRKNWATPLIYRGRLYVKGPGELICFDIRAAAEKKSD